MEIIAPLVFIIIGTLAFGTFTYIAWFREKEYRAYMEAWASIYDRWLPSQKRWILSRVNAWLMRIVSTVLFLGTLLVVVSMLLDIIW